MIRLLLLIIITVSCSNITPVDYDKLLDSNIPVMVMREDVLLYVNDAYREVMSRDIIINVTITELCAMPNKFRDEMVIKYYPCP